MTRLLNLYKPRNLSGAAACLELDNQSPPRRNTFRDIRLLSKKGYRFHQSSAEGESVEGKISVVQSHTCAEGGVLSRPRRPLVWI
jgi:hypothetical protein